MRKLSKLLPLFIVFVFAVSFTPSAMAKPLTSTVCYPSPFCQQYTFWNPSTTLNVHGVASDFTIDNPSSFYEKYIVEGFNQTSTELFVGEMVNGTCGTGAYYYYATSTTTTCAGSAANEVNSVVPFVLSYFVSNGGGAFIYIYSSSSQCDPPTGPCKVSNSVFTNKVTFIEYSDLWQRQSFTNHGVFGGEWIDNEYYDGTQFLYDGTNSNLTGAQARTCLSNATTTPFCHNNLGSGDISNSIPPQGFWHSPPNGNVNQGGQLYTCIYDQTNNDCTLGS